MREQHDGAGCIWSSLDERGCGNDLTRLADVPVIVVEDEFTQLSWRLEKAIGSQHRVDVVKDLTDLPGAVHGMEPDRSAIEDKAHDISERAGAKATALCEMNMIANFAPEPLLRIDVSRDGGVSAPGDAAAT